MKLLKLRCENDSRIEGWLQIKTDTYTAPEMQNVLLKTMVLHVLHHVVQSIQFSSLFYYHG